MLGVLIVDHMVEIDNSVVGISATWLCICRGMDREYRPEWVDVDDAHQVPHLLMYDIDYTELYRCYRIYGCSWTCPRG
jgi:hypothetical protein